jgi:sugar phosphate isomerase/epimerase
MRLAFSAWAMGKEPIERQIAIVREAGYRGIELVHVPYGNLDATALDAAARRGIRRQLDEAGLTATAMAAHANPLLPEADAEMARVVGAIDLAADLGIPYVVTMAFGQPEEYPVVRERVAQRFARLAEHGAGRNVLVCLEPHVGQAFDTAEKCVWLVKRIGSPSFKLNFDNSHFEVMGVDLDEYLPKLLPVSVHTHLKDQRGRSPEHEFLVPGEGEFDYARYLRAMADAGYDGWITVEVSVMVQRRQGYDPAWAARLARETLTKAAAQAGVALD